MQDPKEIDPPVPTRGSESFQLDISREVTSRDEFSFTVFEDTCRVLFSCVKPLIQEAQKSVLSFERKSDGSVVTIADTIIEREMRNRLKKLRPNDSIIGEELGTTTGTNDLCWTLDPIDGTESFICGMPFYGSMIGLIENGSAKYGAVFFPYSSSTLISDGITTKLDGNEVRNQKHIELFHSVLVTSDLIMVQRALSNAGFSHRILDAARLIRTWGDCRGYSLVCDGTVDIMVDVGLDITDITPLIPICRGAGLKISGLLSEDPLQSGSLLVAPPLLHYEISKILVAETPPI